MKAPWVNTLLLVVLISQTVTGYLGMVNNEVQFNWILWLHGIGAYAVICLIYWKGSVIFDALRRKKVWNWQRVLFLLTLLLLGITLVLGLLWTFNGPQYFLNISFVSWHIYTAVPLMILMLWHAYQMRFIFRIPAARNRKLFIRTAIFGLAGLVSWQFISQTKIRLNVPGTKRRFTGSYPRGLKDGRFPVVSWIADTTPTVQIEQWQLNITGAVQHPLSFTYDDLIQMTQQEHTATLDCTGGWYTTQPWQGVPLKALLAEAGLLETAASVTIRSLTGYKRRFSIEEAHHYLLAHSVSGVRLSPGHGFPLRLVAYDKRGVEWVKWITVVEVNTTSKLWQFPLPLQ